MFRDGGLDWHALLQSLERRRHHGPWLFEVALHEEILAQSRSER